MDSCSRFEFVTSAPAGRDVVVDSDHAGLPSLARHELEDYLDVLAEAVDRRASRGTPRLRVVFREDDREAVTAILHAVRDTLKNSPFEGAA